MIKNIVFDVGNILIKGKQEDTLDFYPKLNESQKELLKEVFFCNPDWKSLDLGDDDLLSYYEKHKDLIKDPILREESKEIVLNCGKKREFNYDVIHLLKKFKEAGYKVYILSDNMIDNAEFIKTIKEIDDYADGYCISCFYHKTKDNGLLFEVLLKEFNLIPAECYFIDDIEENIIKANRIGMDGFNLNWEDKFFNDLLVDLKNKRIL